MSDSILDSPAQPSPCTAVSGGLVVGQEGLSEHVVFEQKLNDENKHRKIWGECVYAEGAANRKALRQKQTWGVQRP